MNQKFKKSEEKNRTIKDEKTLTTKKIFSKYQIHKEPSPESKAANQVAKKISKQNKNLTQLKENSFIIKKSTSNKENDDNEKEEVKKEILELKQKLLLKYPEYKKFSAILFSLEKDKNDFEKTIAAGKLVFFLSK